MLLTFFVIPLDKAVPIELERGVVLGFADTALLIVTYTLSIEYNANYDRKDISQWKGSENTCGVLELREPHPACEPIGQRPDLM